MLSHVHLKNFAIVEKLDLELKSGMTALTGETGAGKSILIDAIGLVLGDRAENGVVRHGTDKAEITLTIDLDDTPAAYSWLTDQDLLEEENNKDTNESECFEERIGKQCILRRVITANGKSRAWINGTPCNLSMLRKLGEQVVDIHGQHEHQSLMKKEMQRQMLDDFANTNNSQYKLLKKTSKSYNEWKEIKNKLEQLKDKNSDHQAKLDLLRFQTQELDELQLVENEVEQLDEEHARLSNAGKLLETTAQSVQELYDADERSIYSNISNVLLKLEEGTELDNTLKEPLEILQSAQIQIQEASDIIRQYQESVGLEPERLDWVNTRITTLHALARKHRIKPDQLFKKWQSLQEELNELDSDEYDIDALQEKYEISKNKYLNTANKLSVARKKSASLLSEGVSKAMQKLGMEGGTFDIKLDISDKFASHGLDNIDYQVSANPGQPLKPIIKVASGGELSRISLAVQMIAAQRITLPALIFDEVDSGIGGGIAEIIGQQLRKLGSNRQVLCVTHLPQVASQAHNHYKVTKLKSDLNTSTGMLVLDEKQKLEEIARMMGGLEITKSTLNLAQEMLRDKVA